ncbi:putative peroxiredoxin [Sphingopyxis panaciterrae]|uniref:DsrE family protein n=1 Tax=Sphingopyxis panaciterrae TaxID=363841 RepID=UPI001FBA43C2|nr:DsrE family protein [Sphingopyxis panaciterrae]NIJ39110.1 putative peroxiredoxin [Sphingopyxis panaciterrae]
MPDMPALNIIVSLAEGARFYAALETAMAAAALGTPVRLFLQGEAAALLRPPIAFAGDAARKAVGQPDLASMIDEAAMMGVGFFLCQSGMALAGMTAPEIAPDVRIAGLVSFMANIEAGDRLVVY